MRYIESKTGIDGRIVEVSEHKAFVVELFTTFREMAELYTLISKPKEEYDSEDHYYNEILTKVDTVLFNFSMEETEYFYKVSHPSTSGSLRRLGIAIRTLYIAQDYLDNIALTGALSKDMGPLIKAVSRCLAEVAYFILFEYDVETTFKSLEAIENKVPGAVLTLHVVFPQVSDELEIPVKDIIGLLHMSAVNLKPKLSVFEKYPELYDDFYEAVGPYFLDFERVEDLLTKEIVEEIIEDNGEDIYPILYGLFSKKGVEEELEN